MSLFNFYILLSVMSIVPFLTDDGNIYQNRLLDGVKSFNGKKHDEKKDK